MSYHRKSTARRLPMGDAAGAIAVANDVLHDPYFNEALCRVKQLQAIESKQPVVPCSRTAPGIPGGVGLRMAMPPLRAYVWSAQKPLKWPLYAAAAGVFAVPFLLGLAIGKGK